MHVGRQPLANALSVKLMSARELPSFLSLLRAARQVACSVISARSVISENTAQLCVCPGLGVRVRVCVCGCVGVWVCGCVGVWVC